MSREQEAVPLYLFAPPFLPFPRLSLACSRSPFKSHPTNAPNSHSICLWHFYFLCVFCLLFKCLKDWHSQFLMRQGPLSLHTTLHIIVPPSHFHSLFHLWPLLYSLQTCIHKNVNSRRTINACQEGSQHERLRLEVCIGTEILWEMMEKVLLINTILINMHLEL